MRLTKSAVNKVIEFIGETEAGSAKPFNRFTDTLTADVVDPNFQVYFFMSLFSGVFPMPGVR